MGDLESITVKVMITYLPGSHQHTINPKTQAFKILSGINRQSNPKKSFKNLEQLPQTIKSQKRAFKTLSVDKPARLIIRLLFGFGSDSVFVKLNKNENKY